MPSPADATIAALRSGHDDLAAFVAGLSSEQLTTQSVATEWDVSQVVSHLGSGAVIGLEALEATLEGRDNRGMDFNKEVWARWDGMSPAQRQAEFPVANAALVERYEGLDAATRNDLRIDLGFLPQPVDVKTAGTFRLNEFALHSWDVRASFDPAATVRPEAVEPLLEQVAFLLGWVGKADRLGRTAAVAVTTTAPDRTFGLSITDAVAVGGTPDAPDATLSLAGESWLRLVTGRLRPEHTPAVVATTGSVDLDDLRRVFPGF